jgi:uncharacterized DUF497 family protein
MNWRAGVDDEHYVYAMRIEDIDESVDYGEERTRTIGMTRGNILFVVTTMRDEDLCRIISARRATRHEQNRYYATPH